MKNIINICIIVLNTRASEISYFLNQTVGKDYEENSKEYFKKNLSRKEKLEKNNGN